MAAGARSGLADFGRSLRSLPAARAGHRSLAAVPRRCAGCRRDLRARRTPPAVAQPPQAQRRRPLSTCREFRMNRVALAAVFLVLLLAARRPASDAPTDAAAEPAAGTPALTAPAAAQPDAAAADGTEPERPDQPGLNVTTIDGSQYDLAERRGQWVVVNFWATWCSPCLKEMPELSALHTMREHISVVGLAYEEIDVPAMQSFLTEHPVAYPIAIIDVYAPPADFETPRGLPMTYLIAPDGKVARQFLGPVTAKEIETAIEGSGGPRLDALPAGEPEQA